MNKLAFAPLLLLLAPLLSQTPQPARKRVLAWGDTITAFEHDSVSHALATMERLGRESGAYEMYIRTDSDIISYNPKKTDAFIYGGFDLEVVDQVPIVGPVHAHNARYIAAKRDKMGHLLSLTKK